MDIDLQVDGNVVSIDGELYALQPLLAMLRFGRRQEGIWDDEDYCTVPVGTSILTDQDLLEIIERVTKQN